MASGFAFRGGTGRCYPFWMDYMECLQTTENPLKCSTEHADYEECIHHRRELLRTTLLANKRQEYIEKQKPGDKEPGWEMKERLGFDANKLARKRMPKDSYDW